jgi:hypothetical protein
MGGWGRWVARLHGGEGVGEAAAAGLVTMAENKHI